MNEELRPTLYKGKVCPKHLDKDGLRYKVNATCVECSRLSSLARAEKARVKDGKPKAIRHSKEEAAERIRARDRVRGAIRRKDPAYQEKMYLYRKNWRENNREKYLEISREYDRRMMSENIQRRLSKNLRHRVMKAMKGIAKSSSTLTLLGIDFQGFRAHMEAGFTEGMSWDNYGQWHIDHIKPLALFDLSCVHEQAKAFHYSNLQPLWAIDNIKKGSKYHE